jgi:hypothetical protein
MKARFIIINPPNSTEIYNGQRLPTLFSRISLGRGACAMSRLAAEHTCLKALVAPQPLPKFDLPPLAKAGRLARLRR